MDLQKSSATYLLLWIPRRSVIVLFKPNGTTWLKINEEWENVDFRIWYVRLKTDNSDRLMWCAHVQLQSTFWLKKNFLRSWYLQVCVDHHRACSDCCKSPGTSYGCNHPSNVLPTTGHMGRRTAQILTRIWSWQVLKNSFAIEYGVCIRAIYLPSRNQNICQWLNPYLAVVHKKMMSVECDEAEGEGGGEGEDEWEGGGDAAEKWERWPGPGGHWVELERSWNIEVDWNVNASVSNLTMLAQGVVSNTDWCFW